MCVRERDDSCVRVREKEMTRVESVCLTLAQ